MSDRKLYQTLGTAPHHIRLFTLLPAASRYSPLEGHLHAYPLHACPPYEALSYAWGAESGIRKPVVIDGYEVLATSSLDSALRCLRLADTPRVLWVDALCINQSSPAERSHQVSLMRDIYRGCTRDLLWLGPDLHAETNYQDPGEEAMGRGMNVMRRIAERDITTLNTMEENWWCIHPSSMRLRRWQRMRQQRMGQVVKEEIREEEEGEEEGETQWLLGHEDQDALQEVMRWAPVWHRVWVAQEVSLAPRVQLVGGCHTLDWELIAGFLGDQPYANAFHGNFSHGTVGEMVGLVFNRVQSIQHQRRLVHEAPRSGSGSGRDGAEGTVSISRTLDVLARFRYASASDPRDKVYALLGLANDALSRRIRPDYGREIWEVYTEVTAAIIDNDGNLDILCQSPWRPFGSDQMEPIERLPSWAADFRINGTVHLFAQRSIFNAGRPRCHVPCRVLDGSVLATRGVKLGRIADTRGLESQIFRDRHQQYPDLPLEWLLLYLGEGILDRKSSHHTYISGEDAFTAFWRTLLADCEAFPMKRLTREQIEDNDALLRERWRERPRLRQPRSDEESAEDGTMPYVDEGMARMWQALRMNWAFGVTDTGLYAMIVPPTLAGDVVACLDGGKVPVILRPVEHEGTGERWRLVTVAYVHGFMDMEATTSTMLRETLGLQEEDIWLV